MEDINYAIGSHGHYDHASGYPEFVKEGLRCPLYTGAGYFEEKYARDGVKATYLGCGFDETWMKKQDFRLVLSVFLHSFFTMTDSWIPELFLKNHVTM